MIVNEDPVREWERHTCKRGHTWQAPKNSSSYSSCVMRFVWQDADGTQHVRAIETMCLECYCEDLEASYGPVRTEDVQR